MAKYLYRKHDKIRINYPKNIAVLKEKVKKAVLQMIWKYWNKNMCNWCNCEKSDISWIFPTSEALIKFHWNSFQKETLIKHFLFIWNFFINAFCHQNSHQFSLFSLCEQVFQFFLLFWFYLESHYLCCTTQVIFE